MDVVRCVAPGLVGCVCVFACPIKKNSGVSQAQRPPAYVFRIIWPILYILIGFAWWHSKEDLIFGTLTALLGAWIVAYGCGKSSKIALYILSMVLAVTIAAMVCCVGQRAVVYALIPLLAWCQIAFLLNWHDV